MMRNKTGKIIALVVILSIMLTFAVFTQSTYAAGTESDLEYLRSVMDMIKEKHKGEVTDSQLIEGALKGMFDTMDPYTTYFTNEEADSFFGQMEGIYDGIGVVLEKSGEYIVIAKVFPASPAEKAGLMQGDKIVEAGGKTLIGASTDEAVSLIKGNAGTKVNLGILRVGESSVLSVDVMREQIKINPVTYEIRGNIGYIKLEIFNENTNEFMTKALKAMDRKEIRSIILDLRGNPGGEVNQAVSVAQKFVPAGLITKLDFQSEYDSDIEYYSDLVNPKYKLAVLVNGMSASASEILSGAIQDTKAGTLIGTKTFGKAKVQNLIPLLTPQAYAKYSDQVGSGVVNAYELMSVYGVVPFESEIMGWTKITTGMYTTPKGRMIDEKGLTPDVAVADPVLVDDIDITGVQKLTKTVKPMLNSEGQDIFNMEKILKLSGYAINTIDTKLDQDTIKAITQFQKDSGLYAYGVADFATQQALNDKLDELRLKYDLQYAKAVELLN